jgi:paraquat-inducible protein B
MNNWSSPLLLAGMILLAGLFIKLQHEVRVIQSAQVVNSVKADQQRAQTYILVAEMYKRFGTTGPAAVLDEVKASRNENQAIQSELGQLRIEYQRILEIIDPKARTNWHNEQHKKHPEWGTTVRR